MKITELDLNKLPLRVKLTSGFQLEESFDPGTIVQVNSVVMEDDCYKLHVTSLSSDFYHNNSVAKKDWFDKFGDPTLTFYQHIQMHDKKFNPETDDYSDTIYVMEDDDFFTLELNSLDKNTIQIKKEIIDAYVEIRKTNNTIPDEILELMKNSSLSAIGHGNKTQHQGSLVDQLIELRQLANMNGLYDAADYLREIIEK